MSSEEKESKVEDLFEKVLGLPEKLIDKFSEMGTFKQILTMFAIAWFIKYVRKDK